MKKNKIVNKIGILVLAVMLYSGSVVKTKIQAFYNELIYVTR